jgi:hypothetical protein
VKHKKKRKGITNYLFRRCMEDIDDQQLAQLLQSRGFFIEIKQKEKKEISKDVFVENNSEKTVFVGEADELLNK